ncbi:hypothetical protein QWZ13_17405 [Reinekea marina]|uniref:hypothetical protein n=1 Tax=Reinekea marina TaxID=1310421 RepID=UPI0025B3FEF4|nr:hypothetical protein [Reinekea marina]MDN3650686.1 hypothetical protein [Reinekea marina]
MILPIFNTPYLIQSCLSCDMRARPHNSSGYYKFSFKKHSIRLFHQSLSLVRHFY